MSGAQLPRARLIDAMSALLAERSYAGVTLAALCRRAHVSPTTFYREFDHLRACCLAVIDDGHTHASGLIADAFAREREPLAGIRAALVALLAFYDRERALARVWFLETLAAGRWALEHRERRLRELAVEIVQHWRSLVVDGGVLDEGELETRSAQVLKVFVGTIETQLLKCPEEPLMALLPPLMEFVARLFLDRDSARVEAERCRVLTRTSQSTPTAPSCHAGAPGVLAVPPTLLRRNAHRIRLCIIWLADHPGASNRQIAAATGIGTDHQTSSMLKRLVELGLIEKVAGRPGHANACRLTPDGHRIAEALAEPDPPRPRSPKISPANR